MTDLNKPQPEPDIDHSRVLSKIAKAFAVPTEFMSGGPTTLQGLDSAGSYTGADGYIAYDATKYSLLKRKHVISWLAKAYTNAELSHAVDLKVGALVVDNRHDVPNILSDGYNGTKSGTDNRCEDDEGESLGQDIVIHAERNALDKLGDLSIDTKGLSIVATRSPCELCCIRILKAGIKEVYFTEQHRLVQPLLDLQAKGVKVVCIPKHEVIEHIASTYYRLQKDRFC